MGQKLDLTVDLRLSNGRLRRPACSGSCRSSERLRSTTGWTIVIVTGLDQRFAFYKLNGMRAARWRKCGRLAPRIKAMRGDPTKTGPPSAEPER